MKRSVPIVAAAVLVIGIFLASANPTVLEQTGGRAADAYYNQLVEAFQAGQVSLKKAVPPGLAQLADPYDPAANYPYRMPPTLADDLSYYRGKFYVYFGPTPALLLLWPWAALTGRYLFHSTAALIFCTAGFLAAVGLLCVIWRRYFPEVSAWIAAAGVLALGLATSAPILLQRADVWEVAIACSYALTTLTLAACWCAWHAPAHRARWLAAASLAFGLAVGARPSVLVGAVILLLPILTAWTEGRRVRPGSEGASPGLLRLMVAAILPLFLCGLALMLYNCRRFDSPFDFGWRYQLASVRQGSVRQFNPDYLWFNFRIYFLEPVRWSRYFPFVRGIAVPPMPSGHGRVEDPFGILPNIPFVWLALAAPLAGRGRGPETSPPLRGVVIATALLFAIPALTLCCFFADNSRYELEFLPALILLAVIGIFALERALAGQPVRRRGVRCVWGLLLACSIAFNLLDGLGRYAEQRYAIGNVLFHSGRFPEAAGQFEAALRVRPEFADAHNNLGIALMRLGRPQEALGHYETAVQQDPALTEAHYNLGNALASTGRLREAAAQYEQALRLKPDYAQAHYNLGIVLAQLGRAAEAEEQYREAVRLRPDMARGR